MSLPKPKSSLLLSGNVLPPPEVGGDFDPFLKPEHIGNGKLGAKGTVTFTGVNEIDESNEYGARIQCSVRVEGKPFTYGIKFDSGSYGRLYKKFGNNLKKWKGTVNVEVMTFKKKLYVAVV